MPKIWSDTIEAHRTDVREAIFSATARLLSHRGLRGTTMAAIAEEAGVGRATLYKYFGDIEAILVAWHEQHVSAHLKHLMDLSGSGRDPLERLQAVLTHYAFTQYRARHADLSALVHRDEHVARAQRKLQSILRTLLAECSEANRVRRDIPEEELARYCLRALSAAADCRSEVAVQRLVTVTLAGLTRT